MSEAYLHGLVHSNRGVQSCSCEVFTVAASVLLFVGWDDEDPDDEFLERLQRELEAFKTNYANKTPQTRKAA